MDAFLTPNQIASKLNLKPNTIRKYIKDGKLKARKVNGHCLRISEEDYKQFENEVVI